MIWLKNCSLGVKQQSLTHPHTQVSDQTLTMKGATFVVFFVIYLHLVRHSWIKNSMYMSHKA